MKKLTKVSLIVFVIGIVGLIVTMGIMLASGTFGPKVTEDVVIISEDINNINLSIDRAIIDFEESDKIKIELYLNLWTDEDIVAEDAVNIAAEEGVLTITEQPPINKFLGMFPQPYELKITIHAPADMIDSIDWRK